MTGAQETPADRDRPVLVDAALWETVALLELVQHEEEVLLRLERCVSELQDIRRARSKLVDRTESELSEAAPHLDGDSPLRAVVAPGWEPRS